MDDRSDGDLARHVTMRAPDAARAEEELCARLWPRLRLYGRRHLGDEAAALDLAQDAIVVVLAALREGRIKDPERVGSFALGTARRLSIENHRKRQRRDGIVAKSRDELAGAPAGPPEFTRVDALRVVGCLEQLAARGRSALLLTFYAELDATVIARELGTSAGNVRVIRHRALAQVADCLGVDEVLHG